MTWGPGLAWWVVGRGRGGKEGGGRTGQQQVVLVRATARAAPQLASKVMQHMRCILPLLAAAEPT